MMNDERKRLGFGRNRKKPAFKGKTNRNSPNTSNELTQLKAEIGKYNCIIASLKNIGSKDYQYDNDV